MKITTKFWIGLIILIALTPLDCFYQSTLNPALLGVSGKTKQYRNCWDTSPKV